jgi:NADH-quinone oxidoreductase subunit A
MTGSIGHTLQFLTVFLAISVAFALIPILLARIWAKAFSPAKPSSRKNAIYECGLESKGDAWIQYQSQYYVYALLFLIFDVESIFLIPFGVAFLELPAGAVIAMLVFVLLLFEGLAWAWMKGVLNWK